MKVETKKNIKLFIAIIITYTLSIAAVLHLYMVGLVFTEQGYNYNNFLMIYGILLLVPSTYPLWSQLDFIKEFK